LEGYRHYLQVIIDRLCLKTVNSARLAYWF
jgi:hypothetical protein